MRFLNNPTFDDIEARELPGSGLMTERRDLLADVIELSRQASKADKKYSENYEWENWETNFRSVFSFLFQKKWFDPPSGMFYLLYKGDKLIAFSGAYRCQEHPDVLLCLVRSFVHPDHRNRQVLGNLVLPGQIAFGKSLGLGKAWITFNDYNGPVFHSIRRAGEGKTSLFGTANAELYKDFAPLSERVVINETSQLVLEKAIPR